jgi:hypothetical protein
MVVVVVWLFMGTQKRLVALHSALDGSRRDGHTARAVQFIDMLVDKAVRNDLSLKYSRVVRSVVSANHLINDTVRKG